MQEANNEGIVEVAKLEQAQELINILSEPSSHQIEFD